jgi:hypothetical protein
MLVLVVAVVVTTMMMSLWSCGGEGDGGAAQWKMSASESDQGIEQKNE